MKKSEDFSKQMKLEVAETEELKTIKEFFCPECNNRENYNFKICSNCGYNTDTMQLEEEKDELIRADDESDDESDDDDDGIQDEEWY